MKQMRAKFETMQEVSPVQSQERTGESITEEPIQMQFVHRIVCQKDWDHVETTVQRILLEDDPTVDSDLVVLDMRRFVNLVELRAGDNCCRKVVRVVIVGLTKLERIVVGGRSFRTLNYRIKDGKDPTRHFYLKDCEKLKEVNIGLGSFKDFSVCEIQNLPSLETMDLGCVEVLNCVFCFANLELRSEERRRN